MTTRTSPKSVSTTASSVPRRQRILGHVLGRRALSFVRVRWLVPPCMAAGVAAGLRLQVEFHWTAVLLIAAFILIYNTALYLTGTRIVPRGSHEKRQQYLHWQVGLDYSAMFLLIHFTGGAASPFIFFFIFHIIFASMLLPPVSAFAFAFLVVAGMGLLPSAEYLGLLEHHPVSFHGRAIDLTEQPIHMMVELGFFSASIFITAAYTTSIMKSLRVRVARVAEIADQANRNSAQLRTLLQDRSRFMWRVAHNLRAPLAAIVSMLEMVRGSYLGGLSAQQDEYLRRTVRRAKTMMSMVDELMVLSEHQSTHWEMERKLVDPTMLATRLRRTFEKSAAAKALDFEVDVGDSLPWIEGDFQMLEQMVENLTSNAIKYTERGLVTVTFSSEDDDRIRIEVRDTGIGIPEASRPEVFKEFFRAPNAREMTDAGTGLGLSLVQETVRQHRGQVDLFSRDHGTSFVVTLPAHHREDSP